MKHVAVLCLFLAMLLGPALANDAPEPESIQSIIDRYEQEIERLERELFGDEPATRALDCTIEIENCKYEGQLVCGAWEEMCWSGKCKCVCVWWWAC